MDGKRGPVKARIVCLCLVGASAAFLLGIFLCNREPRYEGTCLSDWLKAPQSVARGEALDSFGTNALPSITRWLMQTNPKPHWRETTRAFLRRNTKWSWDFLEPLDRQQLAFRALSALGTNGAPVASDVAKLLTSPAYWVRDSAMTALGAMGPAGNRALIKALEESPDDRWPYIARTLERLGQPDEEAAEVLIRQIGRARLDSDRATCLNALAKVGRYLPSTVGILQTSLFDESQAVRDAAVIGLCSLGPRARPAVPAMMSLTNISPAARQSLVQHLKPIELEAALPHLTIFLRDPDPAVRSEAISELSDFLPNHPELIAALVQQVRDPAPAASTTALQVLKKRMRGPAEDLSGETARRATRALVSLYGELKSTSMLQDGDPELIRVARALKEIDPQTAAAIGITRYTTDTRGAPLVPLP